MKSLVLPSMQAGGIAFTVYRDLLDAIDYQTGSPHKFVLAHEGMALKNVYSQSVNYLVTIEKLAQVEKKKQGAPRTIDHFVVATEPEWDDAVAEIAETAYSEAESVSPIIKKRCIVAHP